MNAPVQAPISGDDDLLADLLRQRQVERFYYEEAALLDGRRFRDWLDLFAEDLRYWMPIRQTRTSKELDKEFTPRGAMAFFDDDKGMLERRVKKFETGFHWSEDPPSRTRRLVTNIRVIDDGGQHMIVESNFHYYRNAGVRPEEDNWFGMRRDKLRRCDAGLLVAARDIYLDHTTLLSRNLSVFF